MYLEINSEVLARTSNNTRLLVADTTTLAQVVSHVSIGSSYTSASGFIQLAFIHGKNLSGVSGSAESVLKILSTNLRSASMNLHSMARAFAAQERLNSEALSRVDSGGAPGASAHLFSPDLPSGFSPLFKTPVAAVVAPSLQVLLAQLQASQGHQCAEAAGAWTSVARKATSIAASLADQIVELSANNAGIAIVAAANRLREIHTNAAAIAANAPIMATSVAQLESTRLSVQAQVAALNNNVNTLKGTPEGALAAQAVEAAVLPAIAGFITSALTAIIPPVANLALPDTGSLGGAAMAGASGVNAPYKKEDFRIGEATKMALDDLQRSNPEVYAQTQAALEDLAFISGVPQGQIPSHPADFASAAAAINGVDSPAPALSPTPTTSAILGANGLNSAGAGSGAVSALAPLGAATAGAQSRLNGVAKAHGFNSTGKNSGFSQLASGQQMGPSAGALGAHPTADGLSTRGISLGSAGGGTGGWAGGAAVGGVGVPRAGQLGGAKTIIGNPSLVNPIPANPGVSNPGLGNPGASQSTSAMNPAAGASNQSGSGFRGGMPIMMGAGGHPTAQGGDRRTKLVTSKVEYEGNMRDLLGERPAVVPGVIGDWVRDDPPSKY